jgi:hypothetical protein
MRNIGGSELSGGMPCKIESGIRCTHWHSSGRVRRGGTLVGASDGVRDIGTRKSRAIVAGGSRIIRDFHGISPNGKKGMTHAVGFQLHNYEITQLLNFPIY